MQWLKVDFNRWKDEDELGDDDESDAPEPGGMKNFDMEEVSF